MKQPTCNCGRVISSKLRKIPHKFDKRCERILEQQAEQDAWNMRGPFAQDGTREREEKK